MLRSLSLFLAAGVVAFGGAILTNLPGNDGSGVFLLSDDFWAAGFTMGPSTYALNSVDLRLQVNGTVPTTFSASIVADSGSVTPGSGGVSLGSQMENAGAAATFNFTPVSGFQLLAGHTYWIVVGADTGNGEWLANFPGVAASNAVASMLESSSGPNMGSLWQGAPGTFTSYDVNATLTGVPEPSTLILLGAGLVGGVSQRRKIRVRCNRSCRS